VVVTQGTLATEDLGLLIRPTLEALAEEEVLVLATVGRDLGPARQGRHREIRRLRRH
jgi:hypothetical protein